jgi:hypothetical protein
MSDFINNPGGLTQAVRTPEVRAQADYDNRGLTSRIAAMYKKGLSFSPATDTFVDADGVAHYDKQGVKITCVPKEEVAKAKKAQGPYAVRGKQPIAGFIAPPIQQAPPAITINDIVHQFKIYDPVQQQILQTILTQ